MVVHERSRSATGEARHSASSSRRARSPRHRRPGRDRDQSQPRRRPAGRRLGHFAMSPSLLKKPRLVLRSVEKGRACDSPLSNTPGGCRRNVKEPLHSIARAFHRSPFGRSLSRRDYSPWSQRSNDCTQRIRAIEGLASSPALHSRKRKSREKQVATVFRM